MQSIDRSFSNDGAEMTKSNSSLPALYSIARSTTILTFGFRVKMLQNGFQKLLGLLIEDEKESVISDCMIIQDGNKLDIQKKYDK